MKERKGWKKEREGGEGEYEWQGYILCRENKQNILKDSVAIARIFHYHTHFLYSESHVLGSLKVFPQTAIRGRKAAIE